MSPHILLGVWLLIHAGLKVTPCWYRGLTYKRRFLRSNKVHEANMGPTWVLSATDGPHVGHMNLAIRDIACTNTVKAHPEGLLYVFAINHFWER